MTTAPRGAVIGAASAAAGPRPGRRPRIAFLTYGSGQYDARTFRMARSALAAGYEVIVYARWYEGLPVTEDREGYRLVRAPWDWRLAVPGLRGGARRRADAAMAAAADPAVSGEDDADSEDMTDAETATPSRPSARRLIGRVLRRVAGRVYRWRRLVRFFPLDPLGWAAGLEAVAEPADIWHGMWAGSLPSLVRLQRRFGGRTIYDSRDVYMQSRDFAALGAPLKPALERLERRWVRRVDRVLTVNASYAALLARQLGIDPPPVVMNCPDRWWLPDPPPDRIRQALGIPDETAVVLYQGGLLTGRGIEQSMAAILQVPGAVLCLLGFGRLTDSLTQQSRTEPYEGRVMLLDPVPPEELLQWTASADVSVMAIQPTSLNHAYTTPQKLFESVAAGVPVVAADLPGMADIVRAGDLGVLCDPTSPTAIAEAIQEVLALPVAQRGDRRRRILAVAHERYNWETQVGTLLETYAALRPTD